jgi:hypothetical protein
MGPWGCGHIMGPAYELQDHEQGPAVFMKVVLQAHPSAAHTRSGPTQFSGHDMGSLGRHIAAASVQPYMR